MQFVISSHKAFYKLLFYTLCLFTPLILSFFNVLVFDTSYLAVYLICSLIILFVLIWRFFVFKLQLIANQIANIIAKQPYEKLPDLGLDEFGLISYFVNDLIYNFENIASYIKSGQRMYTELSMAQHVQENLLPSFTKSFNNYDVFFFTRAQCC